METETKKTIWQNLKDKTQWIRILWMILFVFIFYVAIGVLFLLAVVQALFALTTGKANGAILKFSKELSSYLHQIFQFWTYTSDYVPIPHPDADWPEEDAVVDSVESVVVEAVDDVTPPQAD